MPGICPPWLSLLLTCGLRHRGQDPFRIVGPFVQEGATVADVGCGPGFFTGPMAHLAGEGGRVIAVDVQQGMLNRAKAAARRVGMAERIDFRLASATDLTLDEGLDFVLAFAVLHEMRDPKGALEQITAALRPGGRLLLAEPTFHVHKPKFTETVRLAESTGLYWVDIVDIPMSHAAVLRRD
ncbi:MAG: class I SAM-dependent methyltransferase [Armatimonadetes bacterium]|nr:class I SAM-dependent methyltransferase [Armatimonadota bacterium]